MTSFCPHLYSRVTLLQVNYMPSSLQTNVEKSLTSVQQDFHERTKSLKDCGFPPVRSTTLKPIQKRCQVSQFNRGRHQKKPIDNNSTV